MGISHFRKKRIYDSTSGAGDFVWLVSLSDLMMLLFVFFVVLFSFSYQKWDTKEFKRATQMIRGEDASATPLDEVQAKLLKWVVSKNLLDSVEVVQKQDSLILQIKEHLLFQKGEYDLNDAGKSLVALISSAIEKIPAPYRIGIEGHTDDSPVATRDLTNKGEHDNWELSTRRAHSVLIAMSLPPELLQRTVIMGYGAMDPKSPNRDAAGNPIAENQASNRRVTIRIF